MGAFQVLIFLTVGFGAALPSPRRVMVCYHTHPQFAMLEENTPTGRDVDLMNAIGKRLNLQVTYHEMPWVRCMANIKRGTMDLSVNTIKSPKRESFAYYSVPYATTKPNFYILKSREDLMQLKSISDFSKKMRLRIGIIRDAEFGPDYQTLKLLSPEHLMFYDAVDDSTNFQMLMAGRLDAVLTMDHMAEAHLKRMDLLKQVVRSNVKLAPTYYHVAGSKAGNQAQLIKDINAEIGLMDKNGELNRIEQKYRKQNN